MINNNDNYVGLFSSQLLTRFSKYIWDLFYNRIDLSCIKIKIRAPFSLYLLILPVHAFGLTKRN